MVGSILKNGLYSIVALSLFVVISLVLDVNFKIAFLIFLILVNYILIRINIKKRNRSEGLSELTINHGYGKHDDLYEYHRIMSVKYYTDYK